MTKKSRNKIIISIMAAILLVTISSGKKVVTSRNAFIISNKTIYCRISGFVLFPLTAEGAFPAWTNGVYVELNEGISLPSSGRIEYIAFRDFNTRYNEITSGTALVDLQKKIVKVNFAYNDSYKWQKVNGDFSIVPLK